MSKQEPSQAIPIYINAFTLSLLQIRCKASTDVTTESPYAHPEEMQMKGITVWQTIVFTTMPLSRAFQFFLCSSIHAQIECTNRSMWQWVSEAHHGTVKLQLVLPRVTSYQQQQTVQTGQSAGCRRHCKEHTPSHSYSLLAMHSPAHTSCDRAETFCTLQKKPT